MREMLSPWKLAISKLDELEMGGICYGMFDHFNNDIVVSVYVDFELAF